MKDKSTSTGKTLNLFWATMPLVAMLLIVIIGKGILGLKIEVLLLMSAAVASISAFKAGVTWNEMFDEIASKIHKSLGALLLLIVVGTIIGTWMASGTIPMMIYYGIQIIAPKWLLVTAFILCAIVSISTGTSWGSVSTVGVAIMGIAVGFGSNLAAVAGAVVAGAYFGDKLSPLSDTTNLAPIAAGSELYEHIKHMLWTTVPASIISLIVYAFVGLNGSSTGNATSQTVIDMINGFESMYTFNLLLLIPVLIILLGSIFKMPSIPVMLISATVAGAEAIIFQNIAIKDVFVSFVDGFNINMITVPNFDAAAVMPEIAKLVNRGGMMSMMGTILVILCAYAFSGIMSSAGCMEIILEKMMKSVKNDGTLILYTVLSCILMAMTTGAVHLTILIPGELFKDAYIKRGLSPVNLSRTLEDAGTVTVPIVPWSASGVYMAACTGVAVTAFMPWAMLCYLCSIFAVIYGFTGIGIKRIKSEATSK